MAVTATRQPVSEPVLTPRERQLAVSASWLLVGVGLHGVWATLLTILGIAGASNPPLFETLRGALLGRYTGPAEYAWVILLGFALAGLTALLLIRAGVQAHERWAWLVALATLGGVSAALVGWGYLPALLTAGSVVWGLLPVALFRGALRRNPVAGKELRERMRGGRAFAVITVYLLLMSAFAVLLFLANAPFTRGLATSVTGDLGRTVFVGLVGLELALIMFIAPAFTAGAVTGERERQTYDLLKITLLPRPTFLIGKLESALGFIVLLLLAAIPLQSIAFLFGGVSEAELIVSFVLLTVTAVTFGAVGIFFSTLTDKTVTASVRSYSAALIVLIGVPVLVGLLGGFFFGAYTGSGTGFNGSPAYEALAIYFGALLVSLNPFTAGSVSQTLLIDRGEAGLWSATLSSSGGAIPLVSPWISFTVIYLIAAVVLVALAVRRIKRSDE
jgi:ABC-2 type transport system permease protein